MPIKPHPDFRPDPRRAIFVQGQIDQHLVDRLTPRIVELQAESRQPITIFIDSPGGSTDSAEVLRRLVLASDQDSSGSCRLITVVTSWAASAAADLLFAGAYAIAYPDSQIHCHGVRDFSDRPITAERASWMTESLRSSNDWYATELARRSHSRFLFRYTFLKPQFRTNKLRDPARQDLACFIDLIRDKLTKQAQDLLGKAEQRNRRYQELVDFVGKGAQESARFREPDREADGEAVILKEIIEYEYKMNPDKGWTFAQEGLSRVGDDFALLREYMEQYDGSYLDEQCARWKQFFLTPEDHVALAAIDTDDGKNEEMLNRVKPRIRPIWLFFVALCHALQEDENRLTPSDAYWLGLIDEVWGVADLVSLRTVVEHEPDPIPIPAA